LKKLPFHVYPLRNAFWLFDTFVQGHCSPHLALLPATKLCKEEHGTISSERHINYINNNYLQDFGGIDPGKSACRTFSPTDVILSGSPATRKFRQSNGARRGKHSEGHICVSSIL
jgi:hypothetical protein